MNKALFGIVIAIVLIAGGYVLYVRQAGAPVVVVMDDRVRGVVPFAGALISSPLAVSGEARGTWYFEASFPLVLLDADRNEIAQGHAQAQGEWMTEDFVPFMASLPFASSASDTGYLVLKRDNPSGLPQNDASVEIPVRFR